MRLLLLLGSLLILAGCQSTPTWLGAPQEIQQDTFYFGEVEEADEGWLWHDCVSGQTRPIIGKHTFNETPHGPVSTLARGGEAANSPIKLLQILGIEVEGSCAEHANADFNGTLWQMVAWPQQSKLKNANFQLLVGEDGSMRGSLDCYKFDADISNTGKGFTINSVQWAEGTCESKGVSPDAMPEHFLGYWRAITYGNTLVLTNLHGEKIFFRALYL